MTDPVSSTEERKNEHLSVTLDRNVEPNRNSFDDVVLLHNAFPEIDLSEVDLSCDFMGRTFAAPIFISGMTGGTEEAKKINQRLAIAADQMNIPMGVGSQRAAIERPEVAHTFQVRSVAPDIFLVGNLGLAQFITNTYGPNEARRAVDMIGADALALHINPSQEVAQPEGDTCWKGGLEKIAQICTGVRIPVIAKEVGAGISGENAKLLQEAGVAAIDVSGLGGTSWPLIESYRSEKDLGITLSSWGIPSCAALVESQRMTSVPLIASGGIRSGVDIAKALCLGASMCGMALPFRTAAETGSETAVERVRKVIDELRAAVFLTGSRNAEELRTKSVLITGSTREWLELRGIDVTEYARR